MTGLVLTKLDGTAQGGIVVAIARRMGLPIRYIGMGEKAADFAFSTPGPSSTHCWAVAVESRHDPV